MMMNHFGLTLCEKIQLSVDASTTKENKIICWRNNRYVIMIILHSRVTFIEDSIAILKSKQQTVIFHLVLIYITSCQTRSLWKILNRFINQNQIEYDLCKEPTDSYYNSSHCITVS
jgi:hypothetical protein